MSWNPCFWVSFLIYLVFIDQKKKKKLGDIFTKALNGDRVSCNKLSMINVYAPT